MDCNTTQGPAPAQMIDIEEPQYDENFVDDGLRAIDALYGLLVALFISHTNFNGYILHLEDLSLVVDPICSRSRE